MKYSIKTLLLLLLSIQWFSCSQVDKKDDSSNQGVSYFGRYGDTTFTEDQSVDASHIIEMLNDKDSVEIKVAGTIKEVCQAKGCWMSIPMNEGNELFVKFKDYAFFMPMNAAERETVFKGIAFKQVTSVEQLKHLAEDKNKSEEEIASIMEPEVRYTFRADGVIIK